MGWLTFCAVAALAVINVRVATLDGSTAEGPLRAIGQTDVRLGGEGGAAERVIALEQVLSIERLEPASVSPPAMRAGLAGGSRIALQSVTTAEADAQLTVRNQTPLTVPLKQLRWIRFRSPSTAVDPQWLGLVERPRAADALVIRRPGDAIDEVSGIVLAISDESVSFDLDGDTIQAPLSRLEGLLFASTADEAQGMPQGSVTVDDIDGSRWIAAALGPGSESELELELGNGLIHRLPLERISRMELSGAVEFLAAQPPVEASYAPYLSIGLSSDLASRWFGPQTVNDRDLILRSKSHVEYRVADGNQMLLGSVEYDPEVASGGSCVVRVLLDGEPAWEQTLNVSDLTPRGFELPLNGARRVRLEVDSDGDSDLGDTVRVRQIRMTK